MVGVIVAPASLFSPIFFKIATNGSVLCYFFFYAA
jgi:hypothetical protein